MYQVFNMGHRFEIYTDKKSADTMIKMAEAFNIEAKIVGYCEAAEVKGLTLKTENGIFVY